ncbi:MAG: hypothetical protein EGP81_05360 [Bacteroides clarus]|jgi:uncharacterized phage protein (TIGR01671 family)|uniref:YopX family protein n=1 Tax=Bacteroides clarus TaxID=626929 RepID=UPI00241E46D9|nr:YopX family protein [Bacteroides clarus]MBD9144972.1 hypothetical protein [Bacteroides clarus]
MKREIKFRAKAINNEFFQGEWVDGYYTKVLWSGNLVDVITDGAHEIPIQIETLGQFTGLHDKNKTRIYEGDIVRMSYVAEICTDDDCYEEEGKYVGVATITANKGVCLNPCIKNELDKIKYKPLSAYRSEVIGNIYDNPDLIKQ